MEPQKMTQQEEEIRHYIATADMNLFVEAGAGAGKTSMLSMRIVNQILKKEPLNSFVIITFTKAAAQELLDRIVEELRKHSVSEALTVDQQNLLKNAILHIDEMQVSTIHSFCRRILLENAFESGFVMDAQMIEDEAVNDRKRAFFKNWKRQHPDIIRSLVEQEEEYRWYGSLYNAFDAICTLRDPILFAKSETPETEKAQRYMKVAVQIAKDFQENEDLETKILTNDQLLYKANQMVMNNPIALRKLRQKFRHFYVDEFQDTDSLQADMIWKLAEGEDGVLRQNALFLVGDPKQSIYRFRGAQVSVFNAIRKRMEQLPDDLCRVFVLEQNFRTNYQMILGWINPTFRTVLKDGYTNMRSANDKPGVFNGTYRCPLAMDENGRDIKEIDTVVELVKEMVTVAPNEVSYKDFLIITKNANEMGKYVTAFSDAGIPVALRSKFNLAKEQSLKNFIDVYCGLVLDTPLYQAKMISVLSGVSYARLSETEIQYYTDLAHSFARDSGFNDSTPYGAAKILSEHLEMYMEKDTDLDTVTLRNAKIKISQCIDTLNNTVTGTKQTYALAMLDYFTTLVRRETPLTANEDAIQLMNVHQTKGLAGKIVIITQRKTRPKEESKRYDNLKTEQGVYPVFTYDAGTGPFASGPKATTYGDHPELLQLDLQEQDDELKRLEYVAATRVRQTMIFIDSHSPSGWFPEEIYEIAKLPDINDKINSLKKQTPIQKQPKQTINDETLANTIQNTNYDSLTANQSISVSPSDFETNGITGLSPEEQGYLKEARPQGNVFGTVMHRAFELLVNHRQQWLNQPNDTIVTQLLNQAINESINDITEKELPLYQSFLSKKLKAYTKSILPDILQGAINVYTEYPFAFTLKQGDSRPAFIDQDIPLVYVNGTMDLVVQYADHTIIYDYKSDARSGMDPELFTKRMQKKYAKQLQFYQFALEKQTNLSNITTRFIDLYQDEIQIFQ